MKKMIVFLKPYKAGIVLSLVLVLVQSVFDLLLPKLMSLIVDSGVAKGDVDYVIRVGLVMLAAALGSVVSAIGGTWFSAKVSLAFGRDLRETLFARIESYSLRDFDGFGAATLITRTTNDVVQVQNFSMMALRMLARAPLMAAGGLVLALTTDAHLSLVLLAALPLLLLAIFLTASKGVPLFSRMQEKLDKLNLVLRESLTGIRVVRAFNREAAESRRFGAANEELTRVSLDAQRIMTVLMPSMMIIMNLSTVAVFWFGTMRAQNGDIGMGALMAVLEYTMHILFSFMMLSMMFVLFPRASVSAGRISELLDKTGSMVNPTQPRRPSGIKGRIEFRDVSFRYPGAEADALADISFSCQAGETTAIIGGTGAGKSTLVNLIPRFYDPRKGAVLLDGLDLREMDPGDLRSRLGFVPQKTLLFSGTVAGNIRYGKPDATDGEVRRAAETAQAAEFIDQLEGAYGALLAQGGINLSGGQKQRIAIARALVREPAFYIFDDSFSALDFKTDAQLRASLAGQTRDATIILVAQRVGTVMHADRIVVLDEGRMADMGTHTELLDRCRVYQEIFRSQLSAEGVPEAKAGTKTGTKTEARAGTKTAKEPGV